MDRHRGWVRVHALAAIDCSNFAASDFVMRYWRSFADHGISSRSRATMPFGSPAVLVSLEVAEDTCPVGIGDGLCRKELPAESRLLRCSGAAELRQYGIGIQVPDRDARELSHDSEIPPPRDGSWDSMGQSRTDVGGSDRMTQIAHVE